MCIYNCENQPLIIEDNVLITESPVEFIDSQKALGEIQKLTKLAKSSTAIANDINLKIDAKKYVTDKAKVSYTFVLKSKAELNKTHQDNYFVDNLVIELKEDGTNSIHIFRYIPNINWLNDPSSSLASYSGDVQYLSNDREVLNHIVIQDGEQISSVGDSAFNGSAKTFVECSFKLDSVLCTGALGAIDAEIDENCKYSYSLECNYDDDATDDLDIQDGSEGPQDDYPWEGSGSGTGSGDKDVDTSPNIKCKLGFVLDIDGICVSAEEELKEFLEQDVWDEQDPYDDWNRLTDCEKEFFTDYPYHLYNAQLNKEEAERGSEERFGNCITSTGNSMHNTIGDAYRHAYFAALNTHIMGYNNAKTLGDAHECDVPVSQADQTEMDLHNNAFGYLYGDTVSVVYENQFYDSFMYAYNAGEIKILQECL